MSGAQNRRRDWRGKIRMFFVCAVILDMTASSLRAAPDISSVSGTLEHKGTVTIVGTGFGVKNPAAPAVWDDASGGNISEKWDGTSPNCGTAAYYLRYMTPRAGIPLPHPHDNQYIGGAHGDPWAPCGSNGGANVGLWKNFLRPVFPFSIYVSWYQRSADDWVFNSANPNYKLFSYSTDGVMYNLPYNWYLCFGPPHPGSASDSAEWVWNDDAVDAWQTLQRPDQNGHSNWWDEAVNPMSGQWSKIEIALRITDQNNGYIELWENGVLRMNYLGPTDKYDGNPLDPGTQRTVGIGGYSDMYGQPTNWRYFADVYLDFSLARVILANSADLNSATCKEIQIPSVWSDGSVTATINLGRFAAGQTAYLFVFDPTGVSNAVGYPVTVGGSVSANPPARPRGLRVP